MLYFDLHIHNTQTLACSVMKMLSYNICHCLQVIKMLLTIIFIFLLCWGPKLMLTIMKRHELKILHNAAAFEIGVSNK